MPKNDDLVEKIAWYMSGDFMSLHFDLKYGY